jgi:hypothetical protein
LSNIAGDVAHQYNAAANAQATAFNEVMKRQGEQMAAQHASLEALREELASTKMHITDYAEGSDGVEPWVTDAILAEDLKETHRWWFKTKDRWENEDESLLRNRIYHHLITQLPDEMYCQHPDGDVKAVYCNIISMGTKDSAEQVLSLNREIDKLTKQGRPMASWLKDLYNILSQLGTLGQPRTVAQIRLLVFENLKSDGRYLDVVRDMKRNPHWDMAQIRSRLEAEATSLDDLLSGPEHQRAERKIVKAAKKAAQDAEKSDPESDGEAEPNKRNQRKKVAAAVKKALAAKAHPTDGEKRTPRAEGPQRTPEQVEKLSKEHCLKFQFGACTLGDSCYRLHEMLEAGPKADLISSVKRDRGGPCYNFENNGVCSYGDECHFSHDAPKAPLKANKGVHRMAHVRVRLQPQAKTGKMARNGDLVVLTQACRIPALRGALGQAHTVSATNHKRVCLQLIIGDEFDQTGGEAVKQWAQMANTVGLLSTEYTICPPEKRVALLAACTTRSEHGVRNNGPYSLNAIFDTGSNTLLSSQTRIFDDLKKLDRPEAIEGLDGSFVAATHRGTVTMILGTHQRVFEEAFLCPESIHTIVPGILFDNDEYYFMGKHRAMNIVRHNASQANADEILVTYPRDLTIDASTHYSSAFLNDLGKTSPRGARAHAIYPVPDSAFVWKKAKAHAATRAQSTKEEAGKISAEHESENIKIKKESKAKSLDLLANFHQTRGHRSPEHTARMYEYESGYTLSAAAINEQAPCEACDSAKIASASAQQQRVVPITKVGSELAADTIISMPRSLSGFNHVGHIHDIKSNYGATFNLKTKVCADKIIFWMKKVQLITGDKTLRLHIDGGEVKTDKLVAFCTGQGTTIVENLAHVHSNVTIERRHRTLIETHNAQMLTGGAGGHLWEFSIPNANLTININIPIKALRAAGRLRNKAQRPPTPFELLECHGELISMKKLWGDVYPMFTKCMGKIEAVMIKQHAPRGMVGTYFGPISANGNIEQYGHYMLRHSDKKVIKVRTVKCYHGEYPMRPSPQHSLSDHVSSSGGDLKIKPINKEAETPSLSSGIKLPDKHTDGSTAMTIIGPCLVLGRYKDGDYRVTFPEGCEPQEVHSIKPKDLWLLSDWPDWQYTPDGVRLGEKHVHETVHRIPIYTAQGQAKQSAHGQANHSAHGQAKQPAHGQAIIPTTMGKAEMHMEDIEIPVDLYDNEDEPDKKHNTRSRTKMVAYSATTRTATTRGLTQYTIWDPGKNRLKTMQYPYIKVLAAKLTLPAGTPLSPSMELIKSMDACDVERVLPRHWHQTKGHPYEPFLLNAEMQELQDWLIESIGGPVQGQVQIFVDNQGSISIASNPIQSGRNLHVHARYYYVRDLIYDDQFVIEKLPTDLQVADVGCTFKGTATFVTLKAHLMSCARILHDDNNNPFWDVRD